MIKQPISLSLRCLSHFVNLFSKSAGEGETTSRDLGKMLSILLDLVFSLGNFASINNAIT